MTAPKLTEAIRAVAEAWVDVVSDGRAKVGDVLHDDRIRAATNAAERLLNALDEPGALAVGTRAAAEPEAKPAFCEKCGGVGVVTWLEEKGSRFCSAACPDCGGAP